MDLLWRLPLPYKSVPMIVKPRHEQRADGSAIEVEKAPPIEARRDDAEEPDEGDGDPGAAMGEDRAGEQHEGADKERKPQDNM